MQYKESYIPSLKLLMFKIYLAVLFIPLSFAHNLKKVELYFRFWMSGYFRISRLRKNSMKIKAYLLWPSLISLIRSGKLWFEVNIFLEFCRDKKERYQQKNEGKTRKKNGKFEILEIILFSFWIDFFLSSKVSVFCIMPYICHMNAGAKPPI